MAWGATAPAAAAQDGIIEFLPLLRQPRSLPLLLFLLLFFFLVNCFASCGSINEMLKPTGSCRAPSRLVLTGKIGCIWRVAYGVLHMACYAPQPASVLRHAALRVSSACDMCACLCHAPCHLPVSGTPHMCACLCHAPCHLPVSGTPAGCAMRGDW
jgi:hypothetical protein